MAYFIGKEMDCFDSQNQVIAFKIEPMDFHCLLHLRSRNGNKCSVYCTNEAEARRILRQLNVDNPPKCNNEEHYWEDPFDEQQKCRHCCWIKRGGKTTDGWEKKVIYRYDNEIY